MYSWRKSNVSAGNIGKDLNLSNRSKGSVMAIILVVLLNLWADCIALPTDLKMGGSEIVRSEDWNRLLNRPTRNKALRDQTKRGPCLEVNEDVDCGPHPGSMQSYKTVSLNYMRVLGDDAIAAQLPTKDLLQAGRERSCVVGKEYYLGGGVCAPLKECRENEFESVKPTNVTNRVCSECQPVCDNTTEYEITACGDGGDRVCGPKRKCESGYYETGFGDYNSPQRECLSCKKCGAQEYMVEPCTETNDTTCSELTQCLDGQYERLPATPSTDRVCASMLEKPACPPGKFQVSLGKASSSKRECRDVSPLCGDGFFEVSPPTASHDRICGRKRMDKAEGYTKAKGGQRGTKQNGDQNSEYLRRLRHARDAARARLSGEEARKRNNIPLGCQKLLDRDAKFGIYNRPWKIGDCLQDCAIDWSGKDEIDCYDACLCRAGFPPSRRKEAEACSLPSRLLE